MPRTPAPARWLVLAHHASPYFAELFSAAAEMGAGRIMFVSRPRGPDSAFAHEGEPRISDRVERIHLGEPGALGRILAWRPDVVVALGHASVVNVLLACWLRARHRPQMLYFGDTNGVQMLEDAAASLGAAAKLALKRLVLGRVYDCSLDLGWTSRVAHRSLGIRGGRPLPLLAVDFSVLDGGEGAWPAGDGLARPCLACVARLVPEKNLVALVEAWKAHVSSGSPGSLMLVGEGPMRAAIEGATAGIPEDRIRLVGSVPRALMGKVMRRAEALVLPSVRDAWGIVIVEALGCGLPVLASTRAGAALSLAPHVGRALLVTEPGPNALRSGLTELVDSLEERAQAARAISAWVRERYGIGPVARALAGLAPPARAER